MKNMHDVEKILELYNQSGSIRFVAKQMHISRNTVSKYLKRVEEYRNEKRPSIISKSPSYRKISTEIVGRVEALLEENKHKPAKLRLTAKRIFVTLNHEGHKISYTSVKRIVHEWKMRNTNLNEVFIMQVPVSGKRAEFDWGYIPLKIKGVLKSYPAIFMVLNKSLYRYSWIFERETLLEVIQGHIEFFKKIGGIPKTIFYDNLKVVVDDPKSKEINEHFLQFSSFFNFTPIPCNPASPNEKGTDEETVGFVRNYCFSERNEFDSIDQANEFLSAKLEEINSGNVSKREFPPIEGLSQEKDYLTPLPAAEYNNYMIEKRMVSKYSMISFEGNYYSVPEAHQSKGITLKIYPQRIEMVDSDKVIAEHRRLSSKGEYSIDITHYLTTLKRKPGALANSRAFTNLIEQLRTIFNDYYTKDVVKFVEMLELLKDYTQEDIARSMNKLLGYGVIPTYETVKNMLEQKEIKYEAFEYPCIKVELGDPQIYNNLVVRP